MRDVKKRGREKGGGEMKRDGSDKRSEGERGRKRAIG